MTFSMRRLVEEDHPQDNIRPPFDLLNQLPVKVKDNGGETLRLLSPSRFQEHLAITVINNVRGARPSMKVTSKGTDSRRGLRQCNLDRPCRTMDSSRTISTFLIFIAGLSIRVMFALPLNSLPVPIGNVWINHCLLPQE
ncbi:hypothetical protein BT69DRAFT_1279197 [Atractiella rhizophila]|nr:hypothetical protein BT69DRAFT_1279197 [Atractiella rhizophila]